MRWSAGSLGRPFVRHLGLLGISSAVQAGTSLLLVLVAAAVLGPERYGTAALIMSWPLLLFGALDVASGDATLKYLAEANAAGDRERALAICRLGYLVDLGVGVASLAAVAVTAWWASAHIVHDPTAWPLLLLFGAALVPRVMANTSRAAMQTAGEFRRLAVFESSVSLGGAVVTLAALLLWPRPSSLVIGTALGSLGAGLLLGAAAWPVMRRTWGGSPLGVSLASLRTDRRGILRFLVFNDLNVLVGLVAKQGDAILIGAFRGPAETGLYKVARSLASGATVLAQPLHAATYPRLARAVAEGRDVGPTVRTVAWKVGLPVGALALLGAAVAPWFLPLVAGEEYADAAPAASLLIIGSAISVGFYWIRPLFLAQGWVRRWFALQATVAAATLVGWLLLIPGGGFMAAAWWLLAMYVAGHAAALLVLWRSRAGGQAT